MDILQHIPGVRQEMRGFYLYDDRFHELLGQSYVNLFLALPNGKNQTLAQWEKFYPHIQSILMNRPTNFGSLHLWAVFLTKAQGFAVQVQKAAEAKELSQGLLQAYNELQIDYPNARAELASLKILQLRWNLYEKLARGRVLYEANT